MPRTENDTRSPYAKATGRRVRRGLTLVAEMKTELYQIEQALGSGRHLFTTNISERAARLQATMAELEALEEMYDDEQAVALMTQIPDPELNTDQREFLIELLAVRDCVFNASQSKSRTIGIFRGLAAKGLVKEVVPANSNALFFEMTYLGKKTAEKLTNG